MKSQEILNTYLDFYKSKGHKQISNMSLVPEGDSTLLFVNSGMFPLVPYLRGQTHPLGKRLVNVQRSVRFEDIDDIGDNRHTTAFHMIGNWSLGDYFKKEQLAWVYEFLIEHLGLNPQHLYGSVFAGDENSPEDKESIEILKQIFAKYGIDAKLGKRIFTYGHEDNWWQRGDLVGELGGPDSEIYFYMGKDRNDIGKSPVDDQDNFIEIGNSVFMQYIKTLNGWGELPQKNVDFGGGLERIAMVVQEKMDIFETDNFWSIICKLEELSGKKYNESKDVTESMRILSDHIRSSVLIAMDGIFPSNKDQGYVLRRFLRRMIRHAKKLGLQKGETIKLVTVTADMLSWLYPQLLTKVSLIEDIFKQEEEKFVSTLDYGQQKLAKKLKDFSGTVADLAVIAFDMYQSFGYPVELMVEDVKDFGISFDQDVFNKIYYEYNEKHKKKSRIGAEQKFKGGLADSSDDVKKYHTATHLLQKALKTVLGENVAQKGSNNTKDRLRFDFNFERALTENEIKKVENIINQKVEQGLPVNSIELDKIDALKTGAYHLDGINYPERVTIYYIGDRIENAYSKEFCGGPHVKNTSKIGQIKIYKQDSISKGVKRIYLRFK